jgi:hypothetical protein
MVLGKKLNHSIPFVPFSLINPEINHSLSITTKDLFKGIQESIGIPAFLTDHSMPSIDRIHPTKNIKTLMMLALGQDQRLFTLLYPDPTKLGMEAKSRLIKKEHHTFTFTSGNLEDFFLRSVEICLFRSN